MERRRFLAGLGAGVGLSGCLGRGSETDTPTDRPTPSADPTPTATDTPRPAWTDSPTETPRCLGQTAQRLAVGESVRYNDWEFAVTQVELTRTYQFEDESETRSLPEGQQFVIVTVEAVNHGDELNRWWSESGFRLVAPNCRTVDWDWFFTTTGGEYATVSQLDRIEHVKQNWPEVGYRFDPGQRGRMWYPAITDASYDRSDLEIGSNFEDDPTPTRWIPTRQTG